MKVKTQLKAGSYTWNHNQTLVCDRTQRQPLKVKTHVKVGGLVVKCFLFFLTLGLTSVLTSSSGEVTARNNKPKGNLGIIRNVVAKSMIPKTKYDNIVNIGCGWASGINLVGGLNWGGTLPGALFVDPDNIYDTLTDPTHYTAYKNKYAVLVKEALEARDGKSNSFFDVAWRASHGTWHW